MISRIKSLLSLHGFPFRQYLAPLSSRVMTLTHKGTIKHFSKYRKLLPRIWLFWGEGNARHSSSSMPPKPWKAEVEVIVLMEIIIK